MPIMSHCQPYATMQHCGHVAVFDRRHLARSAFTQMCKMRRRRGRGPAAACSNVIQLREKGGGRGRREEEGEGRAIWRCVPHYLCLAGCGNSFVDFRILKLRKYARRRSLYEVACLTVGLRRIVLPDNLFLTDIKWLHSTCYATVACKAKNCTYSVYRSSTELIDLTWSLLSLARLKRRSIGIVRAISR